MITGGIEIENLTVMTRHRASVDDVSLSVEPGQLVALLGPNGAGKSELMMAIAGRLPKASGRVVLAGTDISDWRPDRIRAQGLAVVPEGHHVLTALSVDDNLSAAGAMHSRAALSSEKKAAYAIFPELLPLADQLAGTLSGGQQQMVALAQALVSKPRFLLIDEMSLGLAPKVIERLAGVVSDLRDQGIGVILIEQFAELALALANHCYVLNGGKIVYEGSPASLRADSSVLHQAYLGAPTGSRE